MVDELLNWIASSSNQIQGDFVRTFKECSFVYMEKLRSMPTIDSRVAINPVFKIAEWFMLIQHID